MGREYKWRSDCRGRLQRGAFALTSGTADSALLMTLQPGANTMVMFGANATTGVGLAEAYTVP